VFWLWLDLQNYSSCEYELSAVGLVPPITAGTQPPKLALWRYHRSHHVTTSYYTLLRLYAQRRCQRSCRLRTANLNPSRGKLGTSVTLVLLVLQWHPTIHVLRAGMPTRIRDGKPRRRHWILGRVNRFFFSAVSWTNPRPPEPAIQWVSGFVSREKSGQGVKLPRSRLRVAIAPILHCLGV
jgi:hypothetical protein